MSKHLLQMVSERNQSLERITSGTALDCSLTEVVHFLQKHFKSEVTKLNNAPRPSYQGYELSLLHDGLELLAPLGARSHLSAEQIPR